MTDLDRMLRQDILRGRLKPRQKLPMGWLMQRYASGQTPLREALNRLAGHGFVEACEQRGFFVADASRSDLCDLTKTRIEIERFALKLAMQSQTKEWQIELAKIEVELAMTDRFSDSDQSDENPEWEIIHRKFHRKLIEPCGHERLLDFCDSLAERHYRYRCLAPAENKKQLIDDRHHKFIMCYVFRNDADHALDLLGGHYDDATNIILAGPAFEF